MPYVQCDDGDLYYPAPEVLVVGVTSGLQERVCDLGLGWRCVVSRCIRVSVSLCLGSFLPFYSSRGVKGYIRWCYSLFMEYRLGDGVCTVAAGCPILRAVALVWSRPCCSCRAIPDAVDLMFGPVSALPSPV